MSKRSADGAEVAAARKKSKLKSADVAAAADGDDADETARSEQLIKTALQYLRDWARRESGSGWKFRKATQSFLASALWRADVIPKAEFTIAIQYLSGIQGSARTRLVRQAKEVVRAHDADAGAGMAQPSELEARLGRTKLKRAVKLLNVLLAE
eukprot:g54.t1